MLPHRTLNKNNIVSSKKAKLNEVSFNVQEIKSKKSNFSYPVTY